MKKTLFTLLLLLITIEIKPQVNQDWVARYNGPVNGFDGAIAVAVDSDGNAYVGGSSTVVNGTNRDFVIIKYNSAGIEQWVRNYNGPENLDDAISFIDVDDEGNVFVSGFSKGVETREDITTIKYDSSGAMQWVRRYNGPANLGEYPYSMEVDNLGNVYVFGNSFRVNNNDFVTIKYDSNGNEQWQQLYSGPENSRDFPVRMAVDHEGNVCVTGKIETYDVNFVLIGKTYTTIKYNTYGVQKWVQTYGTISEEAKAIAIDSEGNVYVTGEGEGGFATVKYDSTGVQQWVQIYSGTGNNARQANSIAVDTEGNVYVTGTSWGGNVTKTDMVTVKYNSAGAQQWFQNYNGPGSDTDYPNLIKTNETGHVYVNGYSIGIGTDWDYTTIKYKSNGNTVWVQRYNGPGNSSDGAYGLIIDGNNNVYITGNSYGGATDYDIATIKYSQFAITRPLLNSKFMAGEKDTIKWNGGKAGQVLQIEYSEDNGSTYNLIVKGTPADSGYFIWDLPDNILTRKAKIKLTDITDPTITAVSDLFRIKPYVLTRLNPDSTYYEYRKDRDQWGFSNIPEDMWPPTWYSQFDYQGIDPFTGSQYSQWQDDFIFATSIAAEHMDWVSWVNTFSINACYRSTFFGIYNSDALKKWNAKKDIWGGSCFGIAAANALAFSHKEQFKTKYPKFPVIINPITVLSDTSVKRVVNELFTHQYGNPSTANDKISGKKSPNETLNDIKLMLKEDSVKVRTISIISQSLNLNNQGGHTILAYGIKQDPVQKNLFYIQVYDNSNPTSNIPITIDTLANGGKGRWSTPDWPGWGGFKGLYLEIPSDQYLNGATFNRGQNIESPFIISDNVLEINYSPNSPIRIVDAQGNVTGRTNNVVLNEIPSALPLMIKNGSKTPPYGYSLQTDNYSVVLNEFDEDTVETFFFTGNRSFVYERSGATQTQTDRLFFDGGVSATNPDAQIKTIKLLNLLNENTQEKLAVVRSIELAQNDSVKIENPDSNKVKLISYGTSKNYDIELNYVTENGIERFGDFNIPLNANTSHTFVPVWTNITNTELKVLVDIGNDGIIDDTLSLVNQVTGTGDDQGSLLTPDNYNLAQNYPNPFNPTTKIKWQSPVASHQTLKVYDVLGNEVATLVDEFRNAGKYEVTFDASNLASGIYFYRLQAGSFVETKKMILLK